MSNTTKVVRIPTATPKGVPTEARKGLPTSFVEAVKEAAKGGTMKGADLAQVMVDHGLMTNLPPKGDKDSRARNGLVLRTFMRRHGAWVGQGRTYGMTASEGLTIAAAFVAKVTPPKGVRYAKGQAIVDTPKEEEAPTEA